MRRLTKLEVHQRGCHDCTDIRSIKRGEYLSDVELIKSERIYACIHSVCPYHELDHVKSYKEYLRSVDVDAARRWIAALGIR